MLNLHIGPLLFQIFGNQAAVAMMGLFLAAQQTAAIQHRTGDRFFNAALRHQLKKLALIELPIAVLLSFINQCISR